MGLKRSARLGIGLTALALSHASANAASPGKPIQGYLSFGAGAMPDYEGSESYTATPYLEGEVARGNYFLRFEGGALELNIINSSHLHLGALVGYRMGRGDVESIAVSSLAHVKDAATAGGFIEYEHDWKDPRSSERVTLTVADGLINQNDGWNAALRASISRPVKFANPGMIASIEGDLTWGDKDYMQRYFGISAADALASSLPAYTAGAGLESAGVGFALDQFLSPKWGVGLRLHYDRLTDDAAKSPITDIAGTPNQFFGGFVLTRVL